MEEKEIQLTECRKIVLENVENEFHTFFCNLTQNSDTENVFKNSNKVEFFTRLKEFFQDVVLPIEYYPHLIKKNLLKTMYYHIFKDRYLSSDKDCLKLVQDYITNNVSSGVIYS